MISEQQRNIAIALSINIDNVTTFRVASAKIMDHIAPSVGEKEKMPPTESQIEYAKSLGIDVSRESKRVASAKIQDQLEKNNLSALKSLNLKPGDRVFYDKNG